MARRRRISDTIVTQEHLRSLIHCMGIIFVIRKESYALSTIKELIFECNAKVFAKKINFANQSSYSGWISIEKVLFCAFNYSVKQSNVASTDVMKPVWLRLWRRSIAGVRFTLWVWNLVKQGYFRHWIGLHKLDWILFFVSNDTNSLKKGQSNYAVYSFRVGASDEVMI